MKNDIGRQRFILLCCRNFHHHGRDGKTGHRHLSRHPVPPEIHTVQDILPEILLSVHHFPQTESGSKDRNIQMTAAEISSHSPECTSTGIGIVRDNTGRSPGKCFRRRDSVHRKSGPQGQSLAEFQTEIPDNHLPGKPPAVICGKKRIIPGRKMRLLP